MKFQFFLACCFISSSLFAQRTIVGRVINENNEPWLGTFVSPRLFPEEGEAVHVDINGSFSLKVPNDCRTIYFCYEWSIEVPLDNSDTLNIIFVWAIGGEVEGSQAPTPRQFPVQVRGKVNAGEASKTATVQIKGTETIVGVDAEGQFSMLVPPGHDVLVFSAENHYKTEVRLGEMQSVYVSMILRATSEPTAKKRWWQIFKRKN